MIYISTKKTNMDVESIQHVPEHANYKEPVLIRLPITKDKVWNDKENHNKPRLLKFSISTREKQQEIQMFRMPLTHKNIGPPTLMINEPVKRTVPKLIDLKNVLVQQRSSVKENNKLLQTNLNQRKQPKLIRLPIIVPDAKQMLESPKRKIKESPRPKIKEIEEPNLIDIRPVTPQEPTKLLVVNETCRKQEQILIRTPDLKKHGSWRYIYNINFVSLCYV